MNLNRLKEMESQPNQQKILLVEDTEDNRFMMRRLLEMDGYTVVEARNGQEAVTIARAEKPQLILMDLSLPVIDGLAATRLLRQIREFEETPIIAVSAHDTADFKAEALAAGSTTDITAPFGSPEAAQRIARLLEL